MVIAFPGGAGTANMVKQAEAMGAHVLQHAGVAHRASPATVLVPFGVADIALDAGLGGGPFLGEGVGPRRSTLH